MPQELEEGKSSYRGRSWIRFGFLKAKKSAEVVVVASNEPLPRKKDKNGGLTRERRTNIEQLPC
jgi:hypothetical protein